jgi:putative heme-binding domain-containing protein
MLCQKCHAISGAGGQVGPDLTSIGASAPLEYLVESIVEPNKAVKENFHTTLITTTKGQQLSGIKVRESNTELVLRNAEDREITIPLKDIEERGMGGSLMPDGLADTLTRTEFLDLVRFLSELGKVGPYAVNKARLVRRWQALEATPDASRVLAAGVDTGLRDDPRLIWAPAYSTVAGTLPVGELPRLERIREKVSLAIVRFQLDVTTPGPAVLKLNDVRGLSLWQGRIAVPAQESTIVNLPLGVQTVTVVVDLAQRREPLRIELDDQPGSPARVRVVGGK